MDYKKAFYSKLEDCYLGVKIKDFHKSNITKSGFSNLLKIKEQYFAHIKAYLELQIESEPLSHDIYNKLYTFFDSYLNESGTPFFTDTPIYKNIYAKVYSNSKDTSLFYKTQNLYYVKSDTLYQSLTLSDEQESYEVIFDASEYQQNADNTKNKVLFKLDSISCNESANTDEESPNQIIIKVINQKDLFPELNNVFKQNSSEFSEDFLKSLKQKKLKFNEESLKKIFRSYKKQSEIDFFIHKNAKAFLQEQFDLWMFYYLYQESGIQEWNPEIIAHLQKIKNIAYEIIKLIADFENELKNIWLKPKFAKKVEYVFSVDTILQHANNASALLETIANDKGFEGQIKEWQELKLIDDFSPKGKDTIISPSLTEKDTTHSSMKEDTSHCLSPANVDIPCSPSLANQGGCDSINSPSLAEGARGWVQALTKDNKYRYLPIDTKHFTKETKYKLLSSFENLESLLNGELIKADNFQALNTLMPKYQGKVDLIYIDPPYNTGNDGFIYADNFNHASWLSMMNNRLELARELLNLKGSMFISIDDKEQARLKLTCDEVFGEENFVSNIIWRKRAGGGNDSKHIATEQEYLSIYAKNIESLITNGVARPSIAQYKKDDKGYYTEKPLNDTALQDSAGLHYDIKLPNGKILNGNEHQWKMSESTFLARLERNEIIFKSNDKVYYKHYIDINSNLIPASIWYDLVLNADATQEIKSLFGDKVFDTPKPEKLLQRILEIASNGATPPQPLPQGEGLLSSKIHSPSKHDGGISFSPSLAEGARGWVDSPKKTLQTKSHRYLAPYMKEFSRELRNNPTYAENKLWQELRNKKLGFGFRRQFVIDSKYVADFVCLEKRLIIECDGGQHSESFDDKERDFYLESQNFRILRFWNNEILENLEGVVGKVQEVLNDAIDLTHPLTPSARERGQGLSPFARERASEESPCVREGESEENSTQKKLSNHRQISANQKLNASLVLDFFAGSGTTLAVAQKLGRKWLGVEMGEHFYNVIIPRLKKVIAGFQSGISKECNYKGGGAFRYYELESYEEALSHCEYVLKDSCHSEVLRSKAEESQQGNKRDISTLPQYDKRINYHSEPALAGEETHKLGQYELYKGKDYAKAEVILDYRKSRKLIDRLHKGEIVSLDMSTEYRQDFDIFQTIANLMGWKIERLFLDSKGIESCEFDNGEILSLDSLDLAKYPKLKNLIWWE